MPNEDPPLGAFIRRQREISELSMRQFAEMAGISNPYLSQIERGLRAPSEKVMESIAKALGMPVTELHEQEPAEDARDADTAVVDAIHTDARLSARQRQALLEVYRAFTR